MNNKSWKSLKGDLQFGLKQEDEILPRLESHFGKKLTKESNKYATIDFSDEEKTLLVELKSRRNTYSKYPTTLLSSNKIKKIKGAGKDVYFVFNFTDGLYYLKYDPDVFNTFELSQFQRWDRTDRVEQPVEHYYIPIEALKPITV